MNKRAIICVTLCALALFAGTEAQAQSTYSNTVIGLNPVAYWPLSETAQPPFGAYIATNIGTAGAAGQGFYQTWFQPLNTGTNTLYYQTNNIQHVTGPIGDGDTALNCTRSAAGAGEYVVFPRTTNGVANSAITIQPPFSIEFWAKPSSVTAAVMPIINEGRNPVQQDASFGYATANWTGFCVGQYGGNFFFATFNGSGGSASKQELDVALTQNVWQHMVVTFDGTHQTWFKNGVQVSTRTIPSSAVNALGQLYVPDLTSPLLIGTGTIIGAGNGGSEFAGSIDDVAIYTNVLDATTIADHYAAATNTDSTYKNTVLADNPTIYVRLDEPAFPSSSYPSPSTYPVANNCGLIGAAGNGYYQPGTVPGVSGPPFSGFGGSSRAVAINGCSGAVDVGAGSLPAELNPTSKSPFTVAGWFQANPADAPSRFQEIVGHGSSSWRIAMDSTAAGLRFNPGNNPELQFANTADIVTNGFLVNDGKWHFAVGVSDGTNDYLYIDGLLARSGTGVGSIAGTSLDALLGGDPNNLLPIYNGSPTSQPRYFDGQIAQIAFFTNALSAAQVQQMYSAAGVPPSFWLAPVDTTNNAGVNVTISAGAHGSEPISYQWYQNGLPVSGQTNADLVYTPAAIGNDGNYQLIVTNNYGAVTSSVVTLLLFGAPVIQQQSVTDIKVFAGAGPTLQVTASGAQPISYQWISNGVAVLDATNSAYTLANIQAGATYTCAITNIVGAASPAFNPVTLTVLADPTAPYPLQVLADGPMAYFRLDEADGTTAYDYVGANNGIYTNVALGLGGYTSLNSVSSDPSETSAGFGFINPPNNYAGNVPAYLNFGTPSGSNAEFSVEAWVTEYAYANGNAIVALGYGNGGEQFVLDTGNTANGDLRFFVRNAAGTVSAAGSTSQLNNDGLWHHVVGVCDEAGGHVYLYLDGHQVASGAITPGSGLLSSTTPLSIGARQSDNNGGTNYDYQFYGSVDDVAIYNTALSAGQVQAHYYASGVAPSITQLLPSNQVSADQGGNTSFTVSASGTTPFTYQWYDNNNNPIPDGTNAVLNLSNLQTSQAGNYMMTVNNTYGSASTNLNLSIGTGAPVIAVDLQPANLTAYTGTINTFSVTVSGSSPFAYQWYEDGVPVVGATNHTYTFAVLADSNTYYCAVTNSYSAGVPAVSSTATVIGIVAPTLNPTNFNSQLKITLSGYNRAETLKDFPVLVRLGTNVTGFSYSQFASGTGGDLRFTDAGGTREIPYEINEWNPNGTSTIWVQVPALSGTNDAIWAYWGNAADVTSPDYSTNGAVWLPPAFQSLPSFDTVYHLEQSGFPYFDSTMQYPATNGVALLPGTGIVGAAGSFANSQYLDAGSVNLSNAFTLSAWINVSSTVNNIQGIWGNGPGGYTSAHVVFYVNDYNTGDGALILGTGNGTAGTQWGTAPGAVSFGQWHLVTAVVDRADSTAQLYVDGSLQASGTIRNDFPTNTDMNLGRFNDGSFTFNGLMDESRIRSGFSSSNWVWASYMTVAQNASFANYSNVVTTVATPPSPVTIQVEFSGGSLNLNGTGGPAGATYYVVGSTNLALPLAQWTVLSTNTFDGSGNFNVNMPVDTTRTTQFLGVKE